MVHRRTTKWGKILLWKEDCMTWINEDPHYFNIQILQKEWFGCIIRI